MRHGPSVGRRMRVAPCEPRREHAGAESGDVARALAKHPTSDSVRPFVADHLKSIARGTPEMTDTANQIEFAIARALRMLREIDAISAAELELMRKDGLVDEPMYREMAGRIGVSDFMALVAAVKDQVPAATDQELMRR